MSGNPNSVNGPITLDFWSFLGENSMQQLNLGADNLVFRVEWDNSMLCSMFFTLMTDGQGVRSSPYLKKSNEPTSPV